MMTKYQLFNILFIQFIFFCFHEASAGNTEKFIIRNIRDDSPPNEWMKLLYIESHDQEYVSLEAEVYKEFPPTAMITTNINYAGQQLPQHEMLLCDSFNDKMFGDDVKQHGFPQPGFPQQCPFGPIGSLQVVEWVFPQEKIPKGTPPGFVVVNITFFLGDEVALQVNAEGEVIQELYGINGSKAPPSVG